MITLSSYRQRRNGTDDPEALVVEFKTKTPFVVWFDVGRPHAFRYGDRVVVLENSALDSRPTRQRTDAIDGGDEDAVAARIDLARFELELDKVVRRLFEPPDLDVDTPPGIVADWLRDRGLNLAASKVAEAEAETKKDGGIDKSGRMLQVTELIGELQTKLARYGNTCVYVRDLSWGAVALNRRDADETAARETQAARAEEANA